MRTRYATVIEDQDRAALDALLSETQTRQSAQTASAEILNATPSGGEQPTPQWRLRQAEEITDPSIRTATIRRLNSAAAADEARARALAEQVLARVLKDGLTDSSQIPVREWVALDAERRQAIETRLGHHAADTEPAPNPDLVDALATQMTQAPSTFARRDLVPAVAHLPLTQWKRFRDWQAGIRRNDPATEDELYAIRRGLQIAEKMLPDVAPSDDSDNGKSGPPAPAPFRAALVEEIDTTRRLAGKSPDDEALREMVRRSLPDTSFQNIGLHFDPQQARRLGALPGQALDMLSSLFLMLLMQSIMLQSNIDKMTRAAPQSRPVPIPPRRANGVPSTKHSPVPNVREGQKRSEPASRDMLPPEYEKKWREPETLPQADRLPPLPGYTPTPPLKRPEGFTPAPPLPRPEGFTQQEDKFPTYVEARPKNDGEPWEWHHHIPQQLWNRAQNPPFKFSPDAIEFFEKKTILIPKDEHWDWQHAAYNRAMERALRTFLEKKAKKTGKTAKAFAGGMTEEDAQECFEYLMDAILKPPRGMKAVEKEDAEIAKEFLENVSLYVKKKASLDIPQEVA